jgi:galactokinase
MVDIGLLHRKEYAAASDDGEIDQLVVAEAPGRIHFLGDNCQRGHGLYLSQAVNVFVRVAVSGRRDGALRFYAADLGERKRATLVNLKYKREDRWSNYLKIAIHMFQRLHPNMKGLNFTISGDIPQHISLSSSGAIELAAAVALRRFLKSRINDKQMLNLLAASRRALFEKDDNIVDYYVTYYSKKDHFIITDEATMETRFLKTPFGKYKILISDSRVPMLGIDDDVERRRDDIEAGLVKLSGQKTGARMADYIAGDVNETMRGLPEELRRHCTHAALELQRIDGVEKALAEGNIPEFAKILYHAQESLRDLYEISCPETDWLVKRAQDIEGCAGARQMGRGFGGCTYAILTNEAAGQYRSRLEDYERIFGFRPTIYEVRQGTGAKVVKQDF